MITCKCMFSVVNDNIIIEPIYIENILAYATKKGPFTIEFEQQPLPAHLSSGIKSDSKTISDTISKYPALYNVFINKHKQVTFKGNDLAIKDFKQKFMGKHEDDDEHSLKWRESIVNQLYIIEIKIKKLTSAKQIEAATKIKMEIQHNIQLFFKDHLIDEAAFIKNSCQSIDNHRKVLNEMGWAAILGNLMLAILGVVVIYVGVCLIKQNLTGQFLFFQPEITDDLKKISDELNNLNLLINRI